MGLPPLYYGLFNMIKYIKLSEFKNKNIKIDGMFISIGLTPQSEFVKNICKFLQMGI